MANADQKIVDKAVELQRHIENANVCLRELMQMGARVDVDTFTLEAMSHQPLTQLRVDVFRRVT